MPALALESSFTCRGNSCVAYFSGSVLLFWLYWSLLSFVFQSLLTTSFKSYRLAFESHTSDPWEAERLMFRAEERILALALVAILTSVALPDLTDLPLRVDHPTSENQNDNIRDTLSNFGRCRKMFRRMRCWTQRSTWVLLWVVSFRMLPGNVQKDEVLDDDTNLELVSDVT